MERSALQWVLTIIARRLSELSSYYRKFQYFKYCFVLLFIHLHILQALIGSFLRARGYQTKLLVPRPVWSVGQG